MNQTLSSRQSVAERNCTTYKQKPRNVKVEDTMLQFFSKLHWRSRWERQPGQGPYLTKIKGACFENEINRLEHGSSNCVTRTSAGARSS